MELHQVIGERRSVKKYDPEYVVSDDELRHLFGQVALSPSSFNLQHWRFVVVRDREAKQRMQAASFGQEQVGSCSAVIVVCGKLNAHEDAGHIYSEAPPNVRERMVPMIHGFYAEKPALQRDEALRSASLAAMTLMLVARDMGLDTGPLIGFDPGQVAELTGLDEHHFPAMLIVLGKQLDSMRPRMSRLPLEDVVRFDRLDGPGLQ